MTRHNATWSEELYYEDDEITEGDEDPDPKGHSDKKNGYWDYRDSN